MFDGSPWSVAVFYAVLIALTIWGVVGLNRRLSAVQQQSAAPVPEATLTK
ncbi:hypothetical protein [Streptomyces sp. NPDC058092]